MFLNPTRLHADATFQVGEGLFDLTGGTLTAFATPSHPYFYNSDKPFTHVDDFPGTGSVITNPFKSTTIGVGTEFKPLGFLDVHGYVLYQFPGYIELGGHFGYDIGIVSADGNIQGQVWLPRDFDIEGNLHTCLIGFCISGAGLVSNRGLTACADESGSSSCSCMPTYSAGGSYRWGDKLPRVYIPPFSSGCDDHLGDFRVSWCRRRGAGGRREIVPPRRRAAQRDGADHRRGRRAGVHRHRTRRHHGHDGGRERAHRRRHDRAVPRSARRHHLAGDRASARGHVDDHAAARFRGDHRPRGRRLPAGRLGSRVRWADGATTARSATSCVLGPVRWCASSRAAAA